MPTNLPFFDSECGSLRTTPTTRRHVALLLGALLALGCGDRLPMSARPLAAEASTSGALDSLEAPPADEVVVAVEPAAAPAEASVQEDSTQASGRFFDQLDAPILDALSSQPIVRIERGRGGRSIGFKVWLEDGTRGYFKPEQNAGSTRWYAEVAAYQLDRELGLGRTPPSVVRTVPFSRLAAAAGTDPRRDEIVVRGGQVRGALIFWISGGLERAPLDAGWEHWVRISGELPAVDPFVAPPHFRRANALARRLSRAGRAVPGRDAPFAAVEADTADRPGELSDLVVFDYLTANQDRWGGNYTNVRTRGEGGAIVYLDNGAGFRAGRRQRDRLLDARVEALERFRARTLEAVRDLDVAAYAARLEARGVTLSQRQLDGLAARRAHLLDHADGVRAEHGAASTPW